MAVASCSCWCADIAPHMRQRQEKDSADRANRICCCRRVKISAEEQQPQQAQRIPRIAHLHWLSCSTLTGCTRPSNSSPCAISFRPFAPAAAGARQEPQPAHKVNSRSVELALDPVDLPSVVSSPLRHHLSSLVDAFSFPLASVPQLSQLPSLTSLELRIDVDELRDRIRAMTVATKVSSPSLGSLSSDRALVVSRLAARWPQRLHRLSLRVHSLSDSANIHRGLRDSFVPPRARDEDMFDSGRVLVGLASSLPTLTDLALVEVPLDASTCGFGHGQHSLADLRPLQRLTQLKRLQLGSSFRIKEKHIKHIAQMHTLQYLDLDDGRWSEERLQWLCEPPHRLQQLEEIALGFTMLSPAHLIALTQLPALTALRPACFDLAALPLLTLDRFPHLHTLTLWFQEASNASLLLPPLQSIGAQLTDLRLVSCDVTSEDQSSELFSLLPLLQSLTLSSVSLPSLLSLRSLLHLRSLSLERCDLLQGEHLLELQHAPSLRKLVVELHPDHSAQTARAREVCRNPRMNHITIKCVEPQERSEEEKDED